MHVNDFNEPEDIFHIKVSSAAKKQVGEHIESCEACKKCIKTRDPEDACKDIIGLMTHGMKQALCRKGLVDVCPCNTCFTTRMLNALGRE